MWGSEVLVRLTPAHLREWETDQGSLEELGDDHERSGLPIASSGMCQRVRWGSGMHTEWTGVD